MTFKARIAGVFYLLTILTGMFGALVNNRLYTDAANLIAAACYVVVTVLFYKIFAPVSRNLSLLAALFSLAGCALGALDSLHLNPTQFNNFVLFGMYCLIIGYLIVRSTFLPPFLGILMALAGLGWLTVLSPQLAKHLSHYTMVTGLVGEGSLTLWLLLVGINETRWNEQASVTVSPGGSSGLAPL
jgi:hypothetical protein